MDTDKQVEEARQTIATFLRSSGPATEDEICAGTELERPLVAHVMSELLHQFDWSLRPGVFVKEFFIKPGS